MNKQSFRKFKNYIEENLEGICVFSSGSALALAGLTYSILSSLKKYNDGIYLGGFLSLMGASFVIQSLDLFESNKKKKSKENKDVDLSDLSNNEINYVNSHVKKISKKEGK